MTAATDNRYFFIKKSFAITCEGLNLLEWVKRFIQTPESFEEYVNLGRLEPFLKKQSLMPYLFTARY